MRGNHRTPDRPPYGGGINQGGGGGPGGGGPYRRSSTGPESYSYQGSRMGHAQHHGQYQSSYHNQASQNHQTPPGGRWMERGDQQGYNDRGPGMSPQSMGFDRFDRPPYDRQRSMDYQQGRGYGNSGNGNGNGNPIHHHKSPLPSQSLQRSHGSPMPAGESSPHPSKRSMSTDPSLSHIHDNGGGRLELTRSNSLHRPPPDSGMQRHGSPAPERQSSYSPHVYNNNSPSTHPPRPHHLNHHHQAPSQGEWRSSHGQGSHVADGPLNNSSASGAGNRQRNQQVSRRDSSEKDDGYKPQSTQDKGPGYTNLALPSTGSPARQAWAQKGSGGGKTPSSLGPTKNTGPGNAGTPTSQAGADRKEEPLDPFVAEIRRWPAYEQERVADEARSSYKRLLESEDVKKTAMRVHDKTLRADRAGLVLDEVDWNLRILDKRLAALQETK